MWCRFSWVVKLYHINGRFARKTAIFIRFLHAKMHGIAFATRAFFLRTFFTAPIFSLIKDSLTLFAYFARRIQYSTDSDGVVLSTVKRKISDPSSRDVSNARCAVRLTQKRKFECAQFTSLVAGCPIG